MWLSRKRTRRLRKGLDGIRQQGAGTRLAGMTALDRWQARPDVPDLLPGEDRNFGSGLFVDLVPSSCWFSNARSCVDQRDWERLRRMITNRKRTNAGFMTIPTTCRR